MEYHVHCIKQHNLGNCVYTTAIDVWSAAVTIGECILGKPMFRGRTEFGVLMRIFSLIGHPSDEDLNNQLTLLKHYNVSHAIIMLLYCFLKI